MAGRLLLLVVCLLAMVTAKAEIASGNGWTLSDEGELTVTKNISMDKSSDYPWYSKRARIKSLVFAEGVTVIGSRAFDGCIGLTSVIIPEGVTKIGINPFSWCVGLKYDSRGDCNAIIETESNNLVSGCQNTTIPEGVVSIGDYSFDTCHQLTSLVIPASVTEMGRNPFGYCFNLTSIKVDVNNKKYDSRGDCNAIIETESNTLVAGCKNTKIPEDVVSIGRTAFFGCSRWTGIVELPEGVTSIGDYAFGSCSQLIGVKIPKTVTSIGKDAFAYCNQLSVMDIPKGVAVIGKSCFFDCKSLRRVTIPESCTSIEESAFSGCPAVLVLLSAEPPRVNSSSLGSATSTVYVRSSAVDAYKKASVWKNHNIVAFPKVTFVDWNDEVLKEEEVVFAQDATAPEEPTREGYDFTGWNGTFTNVTSDVTVKAEYKKRAVVTGGKMITREEEGAWYDLTGKEYDTKPTKRGVYIHRGKMLIVK